MRALFISFLICISILSNAQTGVTITNTPPVIKCTVDTLVLTAIMPPGYSNPRWYEFNPAVFLSIDTFLVLTDTVTGGVSHDYIFEADSGGMTFSDIVSVSVPTGINLNLGADTTFCFGDTLVLRDSLLTSSSVPAPSFTWNNGLNSDSIVVTSPGIYWLQVTQFPNPCPGRDSIIVTQSPRLQITDPGEYNICQGENLNVSVQFDSAGISPYQFQWSPASIVSSTNTQNTTITATSNTTVSIKVTDRNGQGCSDSLDIPVFIRSQPQINLAFTDSTVCLGEDITLSANGSGGTPSVSGYNFQWTGQNLQNANTSTPTVNPAIAGQFQVLMSDSFNCDDNAIVTLNIDSFLINIINGDSAFICSGQSAQIFMEVIGGDGNESFLWSPDDGSVSNVNIAEPSISAQGDYTVLATSSNGCESTDMVSVGVSELPNFTFDPLNAFYCGSEQITLSGNALNGNAPYKFVFQNNGILLNTDSSSTVTFNAGSLGTSGIETFQGFVIDANFCISQNDSVQTEIRGAGGLSIDGDTAGFINQELDFTISGSSTPDSVFWDFGDGNTELGASTNTHSYSFEGNYTLIALSYFGGCDDTLRTMILITEEPGENVIYVPSAFSVNAMSTENQTLKVYGANIDARDFSFEVFSAWGDVVYETTDLTEIQTIGWDAAGLEGGVYVINCRGTFLDGEEFSIQQSVNYIK